jgi:hypothetical protein
MPRIEISDEAYRALEPFGDPGKVIDGIVLDESGGAFEAVRSRREAARSPSENFLESATRCGLLDGGGDYPADLSSNPAHFDAFGR